MPREYSWTKWLTDRDRVEVRLQTEGKEVLNFAVQYLASIDETWHPVVRFDTAHGGPHIDILSPAGRKETRDLKGMDNRDALTYALSDIDRRWEFYHRRYRRELEP